MDINQGLDKALRLIRNGLSPRDLLIIAANIRRIELEGLVSQEVNNRIVDGPFKGCIHPGQAHESMLSPKLFGTYEKEISQEIQELAAGKD